MSVEPALVLTEPLGGSALSRRLQESRGVAASWSVPRPRSADAWAARAEAVSREFAGTAWLTALEDAFALSRGGAASERLRRAAAGGIVVTTGQQPGLFGGPAYTWTKALSALALADAIERATGIAAAPVFWAATDDSDFEEACWTAVAVHGGVEHLRVGEPAGEGIPMAWTPLGDAAAALLELRRAAGSIADATPLDAAERAYTKESTVGSAYVALARALLEPLGIAVLDATHESVRRAADPLLRTALARAAPLAEALDERDRAIRAEGFEPQVSPVPGLSLVFTYEDRVRQRLPIKSAASRAIEAVPGSLGPNVLLRPVVERAILPTVAYVAGPGELAYFAQTSAVADTLEAARPLGVPRWSGTIIEPHVARLLEKYDLTLDEVRTPNVGANKLAAQATPPAALAALGFARSDLAERLAALQEGADGLLSDATIEGARRDLGHRLDRLERRLRAAVKRREAGLMRDLATLEGALAPLGRRQERVLNLLPSLARQGDRLMRELRAAAERHAEGMVGTPAAAGAAGRSPG